MKVMNRFIGLSYVNREGVVKAEKKLKDKPAAGVFLRSASFKLLQFLFSLILKSVLFVGYVIFILRV